MPHRYFPQGLHTANMPWSDRELSVPHTPPVQPFITISQQIGAECFPLPGRVAQAINQRSPDSAAWTTWDQELVDKVSADNRIPAEFIESLETSGHSRLDDLLSGLAGRPDELVIFHRVKDAIVDLARTGHVILVGHGSAYLSHSLSGGLHIRLIAPMQLRIKQVAARFGFTPEKAAEHIRQLDRQRRKFFQRLGLNEPLAPEMFAAVFNRAELDEEQLTRAIVAMAPEKARTR